MKIAVVGSGVSGLAVTWLLNEHSEHEVHLYDSDSRPGGHANTVRFVPPGQQFGDSGSIQVDTGFIVFNPSTYPNFLRFLKQFVNVDILPTEMTFSVSRDKGLFEFEWAGNNLKSVFCQPSRVLEPRMWRLLYDVLRFNACARRLVTACNQTLEDHNMSIGKYLDREGYSLSFRDDYLIASLLSLLYIIVSVVTLWIQFMANHHLLQITGKPAWLTIRGGSRNYVDAITAELPKNCLHLSTPVISLSTGHLLPGKSSLIELRTAGNNHSATLYDRVILACHSDTALSILKAGQGLTDIEDQILSRFRWSNNEAVLHADTNVMLRHFLPVTLLTGGNSLCLNAVLHGHAGTI
ncbi:hypothetical protein SERLADRAFT_418489 [Serpula lacrymans var. lacrymans S7.9]|uniref:Amine oxidase domain-containing protein n=1 Tax=Serpula lacrymans var. lacrymans (strain S7.9) TaxID=578457 RepID=F8PBY9_SERL9|nr:uncharacterized protein SERLADRAFT_418489 [Serpula lacrymans var. lacrymans S7.9]EGO19192.1 hypothetical protein SERLADRAFT_418489 [Serpula lacrymans var. lacrymans S7.9]